MSPPTHVCSSETKSPLDKLLSLAKYFVRAVHPFMDIGLVLFYGSQAHWAAPAPSVASNSITVPESCVVPVAPLHHSHLALSEQVEQKRHVDAFDKMMAKSPDSLDVLREFYKDNKQWSRIVKRVSTHSLTIFAHPIHSVLVSRSCCQRTPERHGWLETQTQICLIRPHAQSRPRPQRINIQVRPRD